jgi:hypothetical protein
MQRLAVDLMAVERRVPRRELWTITNRVAEMYRGRTEKTLSRDLNELKRIGLIEFGRGGWRAAVEQLAAFESPARERRRAAPTRIHPPLVDTALRP